MRIASPDAATSMHSPDWQKPGFRHAIGLVWDGPIAGAPARAGALRLADLLSCRDIGQFVAFF
jgi:hypothetical protein